MLEFERTIKKFLYRIEAKPEGGFIARSKDSTLPPIEGATRAEVQQKIQQSIAADFTAQFPALKPAFENNQVNFTYHIEAKPEGGYIVHHGDPQSSDPAHAPIEGCFRDKLQDMVESKLISAVMKQIPPELHQEIADKLNSGGIDVAVSRKVYGAASATTGFSLGLNKNLAQSTEADLSPTSNAPFISTVTDTSPVITYEKSKFGSLLRFLLALLIMFGIYFFLRRH